MSDVATPGASVGDGPAPSLSQQLSQEELELYVPHRNVGLAYFCLIFLGWLGVHRFYVRRPFSGTLYALTLGFLGLGLVLDLILLPFLVRKVNAQLDEAAAKDPDHFRKRERVAPWAHGDSEGWSAQLLLVAGFWCVGTPIFAGLTIAMGFESGPVYLGVTLVLISLFGSPHRLVERYPKIQKIPIVSEVLQRLVELEDYYFDHKPRALIYYLFFPLVAPIAAIVSATAREEAKMYARAHVLVGGVIAVNILSKYSFALWNETLSGLDVALLLIFTFIFAMLGMTAYIVPTTSTAFALNLSGRRTQTLLLAAIGGGLAVPMSLAVHSCSEHSLSLPDHLLLDARLKHKKFQCQFEDLSRMYLSHELGERARDKGELAEPEGEPTVVVDIKMTNEYRSILGGFISAGEAKAFTVAKVTWPDGHEMLALVRDNIDPLRDRQQLHEASADKCDSQPLVLISRDEEFLSTAALERAHPQLLETLGPRFHADGELLLFEDWLAACTNERSELDVARDCWSGDDEGS